MADAWDEIQLEPNQVRDVYHSRPKNDAWDNVEYEESFGKNLARSLYQIPSGVAQGFTYPLDLLSMLGHADATDPVEIDRIREISQREGLPFDEEKYLQAAEASQKYFPTQSNIERVVEEQTGAPLTPKTGLQKGLKYASTIGKFVPGNVAQKAIVGGSVEGAKEGLESFNYLPEGAAEVVAPLFLGPASASQLPSLTIGTAKKPSGLTERRFEGITSPTEVSPSRMGKINSKVENDFRTITDQLIKSSPIEETFSAMKKDSSFKADIQELFPQVEELASQIPGTFSSKEVKTALAKKYQSQEGLGFTKGEYDKSYNKFMKEFLKDTPNKNATARDLVEQYRKNNKELTGYFQSGQSPNFNRAKRDALLDYNRTISELIEKKYPNTEFNELFKYSNKKWTEIQDVEKINEFVDSLFDGKIKHSVASKFLENDRSNLSFKRALGEENYNKFKKLNKDLMSQEQAYKLLSVAKEKGYPELFKTGLAYLAHPSLAKAKIGFDVVSKTGKALYKSVLDKPRLAFIWDEGIQAAKKGDFKTADSNFKILNAEILPPENASKPSKNATTIDVTPKKSEISIKNIENKPIEKPKDSPKRKESLKKFNDKKNPLPESEYTIEDYPTLQEAEAAVREFESTLQRINKGSAPEVIRPRIEKDLIRVKEIAKQHRIDKSNKKSNLDTRNSGRMFHGSPNEISSPTHSHYSTQNYYGQGFYTTDALDIASGYASRKGKAKNPTIYEVKEKSPVKFYDMEKPIPKEIKNKLENLRNHEIIDENLSRDPNQTLRQLYDEMRESGYSADYIQEEFDTIARNFEELGYGGFEHIGGKLTGNKPHKVKIYFNPEDVIEIKKIQ